MRDETRTFKAWIRAGSCSEQVKERKAHQLCYMPTQIWIDAAVCHIQADAVAAVALKGTVELTKASDDRIQCKIGDLVLGEISDEGCSAVLAFLGGSGSVSWPSSATIRSIKRETGSKAISELKVC